MWLFSWLDLKVLATIISYVNFNFSPTCSYFCIFRDHSYALTYIPKQSCRKDMVIARESNICSLSRHKLIQESVSINKSCKSWFLILIYVLNHFNGSIIVKYYLFRILFLFCFVLFVCLFVCFFLYLFVCLFVFVLFCFVLICFVLFCFCFLTFNFNIDLNFLHMPHFMVA